MTIDEAQALGRQIEKVLKQAGVSFLLAIEYDVDAEHTRAVWHVGGNNTGLANMAGQMLDGIVKLSEPNGCEACDAALAALERAAATLAGGAGPTCH